VKMNQTIHVYIRKKGHMIIRVFINL